MTKEEFLTKYKTGQRQFINIELENIDLSGEDLSNIEFKECFLSVNFQRCNLNNSKFLNGNIKTCDFRYSDLTQSLFEKVAIEGTRFKGAITTSLVFENNYCFSSDNIGQDDFEEWICNT